MNKDSDHDLYFAVGFLLALVLVGSVVIFSGCGGGEGGAGGGPVAGPPSAPQILGPAAVRDPTPRLPGTDIGDPPVRPCQS